MALIVFEGVEGSGKTTQVDSTYHWIKSQLNDQEILITRQPGGTNLGGELRQMLLYGSNILSRTELFLYAADRCQHVEEFLKPKLAQNAVILCDRYTDSTIAYQGYGRGLDLELIATLNQLATTGLESDLTLWLDIDVAIGLERSRQRGKLDRIEQANIDFHKRVQTGYQDLARKYPDRIVRIDASLSMMEVQEQIRTVLNQKFNFGSKSE
ncbi:MAG TPA: dTMP kinase [Allocoleopsis sp.]